jgi:hypothetical protein
MHPNKDPNAVPSVRRSHHWRSKWQYSFHFAHSMEIR